MLVFTRSTLLEWLGLHCRHRVVSGTHAKWRIAKGEGTKRLKQHVWEPHWWEKPFAPEGRLQPTMERTDSGQHLYCTTPAQRPDLVKYVIVLTPYSPRRVNSIIGALVGV